MKDSHFIHCSKARSFRVHTMYLLLLLALSPARAQEEKVAIAISTEDAIAEDIAQVPCKDSERLGAAKRLFEKVGASAADITTEKKGGAENVILRLKGQGPGTIVIGAHYDKSMSGCGAIDNWTGVVALAHVYRSLKDAPLKKTILLVAFGKEEQGLIGSRAMVSAITKEDALQYCAMINIDSLGMTAPQVAENLSSTILADRTAQIAERMTMPFSKIRLSGAGADSLSFIEKKIPSVTICGIDSTWNRILHTGFDQVKRVNTTSVYLGYRLALSLVVELDGLACEVSREPSKKS